jgi:hypothetical protein
MGDMSDDFSWVNGYITDDVSESMKEQEAIQKKIEAFAQIDEDVKNQKSPF